MVSSLPFIPEGIWKIRAEKDGYQYEYLSEVEVLEDSTTTLEPIILLPSSGVEGHLTINDGEKYSEEKTVTLDFLLY